MPTNLALMISIATDALNTSWPIRMVQKPSDGMSPDVSRTLTKKIREATAITISGTTSVRYTSESNGARHFGFMRASASAAHSPSAVEKIEARAAIFKLTTIAGMYVGSCSPALNQQPVPPFQTVMLPIWVGGMAHTFGP